MAITNGQPWVQQYDSNPGAETDYTWSLDVTTQLAAPVYKAAVFVTKNRVYVCGGYDSSGFPSNTIQWAPIVDGVVGAFTIDGETLPAATAHAQAIIIGRYVYIMGGSAASSGSEPTSAIYMADIATNGVVSNWRTSSVTLGQAVSGAGFVVTNNILYHLGGQGVIGLQSGQLPYTWYIPVKQDGSFGASSWTRGTDMPWWDTSTSLATWAGGGSFSSFTQGAGGYSHLVAKIGNRVYCVQPYVGDARSPLNCAFYADFDSSGILGSWAYDSIDFQYDPDYYSAASGPVYDSCLFVTASSVFSFFAEGVAGHNWCESYRSAVSSGVISSTFSPISDAPTLFWGSSFFATSTRLYLVGAYSSTDIYYAALSGGADDYIVPIYDVDFSPSVTEITVDAVKGESLLSVSVGYSPEAATVESHPVVGDGYLVASVSFSADAPSLKTSTGLYVAFSPPAPSFLAEAIKGQLVDVTFSPPLSVMMAEMTAYAVIETSILFSHEVADVEIDALAKSPINVSGYAPKVATIEITALKGSYATVEFSQPASSVKSTVYVGADTDDDELDFSSSEFDQGTLCVNAMNHAITQFMDWRFTSYANFNGMILATGANGGLYSVANGDLDDTDEIDASLTIASTDLGSSNPKRARTLYFGYSSTDDLEVSYSFDDKTPATFTVPAKVAGLQRSRVPVSRAQYGRYLSSMNIANTNGCDFHLDAIDADFIILSNGRS